MMVAVDDRKQLKINVSAGAKQVVEAFAAEYDMTETGVASRVYEWFGSLPPALQKAIVGLVDGSERELISRHAELFQGVKGASMKIKRAAKPMPGSK